MHEPQSSNLKFDSKLCAGIRIWPSFQDARLIFEKHKNNISLESITEYAYILAFVLFMVLNMKSKVNSNKFIIPNYRALIEKERSRSRLVSKYCSRIFAAPLLSSESKPGNYRIFNCKKMKT